MIQTATHSGRKPSWLHKEKLALKKKKINILDLKVSQVVIPDSNDLAVCRPLVRLIKSTLGTLLRANWQTLYPVKRFFF